MPEPVFYLTEGDVRELKELLRYVRGERATTQQRPPNPEEPLPSTPEVYVALTPSGGIPGRTPPGTGTGTAPDYGDVPGFADCEIWQQSQGIMIPASPSPMTVYNFSTGAIKGNIWILIQRDKAGTWWPSGQVLGGAGAIEVADSTGTPDYPGVTKLIFEGPSHLTQPAPGQAQLGVFVASGPGHKTGLVPDPGLTAGTTKFLREDATWQAGTTTVTVDTFNPGSGDVFVTVTTGHIALDQGSGLKLVNSSGTAQVSLQPASATHSGMVNTIAQTIAGLKTFQDDIKVGKSGAAGFINFIAEDSSVGGIGCAGGLLADLFFNAPGGAVAFQIYGSGGNYDVNLQQAGAAYRIQGTRGTTGTITYAKPAGGSGTITVVGGIITAFT